MELLEYLKKDYKENYLQSIFLPEKPQNCKIPSLFPVPRSSFMTHLQTSLTTNANGNIAFTWNPFFFQDTSTNSQNANFITTNPTPSYSSFFVNNNAGLTGTSANANFFPVDIGYGLTPNGLYAEYRLVSASCVVTYTGRMDIVSGISGIGIGLNPAAIPQNVTPGTVSDPASGVYGNFNFIDDLYFAKRTQSVNGLRAIYFPIDTRFLNFQMIGTWLQGFHIAFYGSGLPPSSNCLRVDLYMQYESTVEPLYNNYITQTPGNYSNANFLEATSDMIHKNPDVVTQPSSDIPYNLGTTGGAAGVGGMFDFIGGLLGPLKKLVSDLPPMEKIIQMAGNVIPGLSNAFSAGKNLMRNTSDVQSLSNQSLNRLD